MAHFERKLFPTNSKRKDAMSRIVSTIFHEKCLRDFNPIPESFELLHPKVEPNSEKTFWGGIRFKTHFDKLGVIEVRIMHDREATFCIQFLTLSAGVHESKLIVRGIHIHDLAPQALSVLHEVRRYNSWPRQSDWNIANVHPLFWFTEYEKDY